MTRTLLILGTLLAAILIALFAVPAVIDWNNYRNSFEQQASRLLGREVRVGGNVTLRLLPAPYVSVENVRIADASGRFNTALLRVKTFTLWLSITPLLSGTIEARQIELEDPEIRLSVGPDGRGNWVGLGAGDAALPFGPKDVAFNAIDIRNGRIAFYSAKDEELLRLDEVTGELSAPALTGPYRFHGDVKIQGAPRTVRVSTGPLNDPAGIRVKSTVEIPDSPDSYSFDGLVTGIEQTPRLEGAVEARIAYLDVPKTDAGASAGPVPGMLELKGAVLAGASGLQLKDLTLDFQSDGKPQQLTGEATADWSSRLAIDARLASRWLDLDHLAGSDAKAGPLVAVQALTSRMASAVGTGARTTVHAAVGQANLGSGLVNDLAVEIERTPERLSVKTLTARLPGATGVTLSGTLGHDNSGMTFEGPVQVRGTNLRRFLAWLVPGDLAGQQGAEGFFVVSADLRTGHGEIDAMGARAELLGTALSGQVRYKFVAPRQLDLTLDSDKLDAAQLTNAGPSLAGLWPLVLASAGDVAPEGDGSSNGRLEARVGVRIGQLSIAGGTARDVAASVRFSGDKLSVERLQFTADNGLAMELSGSVAQLGPTPSGSLRMILESGTPESAAVIAHFLGLAPGSIAESMLLRAGAPLRIAGSLDLGAVKGGSADLMADGQLHNGRLVVSGRITGPLDDPASGHLDLTLSLSDEDGQRLFADILDRPSAGAAEVTAPEPGTLSLRMSGVPAKGLSSVLVAHSAGLDGSAEGIARMGDAGIAIDGSLKLQSASTATALRWLGLERMAAAEDAPLGFASKIAYDGSAWQLDDASLNLGGLTASGKARIARVDGRTRIEADGEASRVALASLLGAVIGQPATLSQASEVADTSGSVWTDRPFDFSALSGIDGKLELAAQTADLMAGLTAGKARVALSVSDGKLVLDSLEGDVLGGKLRLSGSLQREAAGAAVSLEGRIDGARLERLATDDAGQPRAKGPATLSISASAHGLSPRGLLAVAQGKGILQVGPGEISALSSGTVDAVARAVLVEDAKLSPDNLQRMIDKERIASAFPLTAPATFNITIADGSVTGAEAVFAGEKADLAMRGVIDLATLRVDSEWSLRPRSPAAGKVALPAATAIYAGPLTALSAIEPTFDVDALARELAARRILGGEGLQGLFPEPEKQGAAPVAIPALGGETAPALDGAAGTDVPAAQPAPIPVPAVSSTPAALPEDTQLSAVEGANGVKKKSTWQAVGSSDAGTEPQVGNPDPLFGPIPQEAVPSKPKKNANKYPAAGSSRK